MANSFGTYDLVLPNNGLFEKMEMCSALPAVKCTEM